jgi:hypothetical protein
MRMIFGAIGGMKFGRGNRSTRRKPTPAPLCPPQIPFIKHILKLLFSMLYSKFSRRVIFKCFHLLEYTYSSVQLGGSQPTFR